MFHKTGLLALALSVLLLAGCANGPVFTDAPPPSDNRALVYIYRQNNFGLGGRIAAFDVDDKNVFDLSAGGYSFFYVAPGHYQITQSWDFALLDPVLWGSLKIPLDVKSGETHYVRFGATAGLSGSAPMGGVGMQFDRALMEVPPELGRREIAIEKFQKQDAKIGFEFSPVSK
jgi:Protein of unknown function (DUF2846)